MFVAELGRQTVAVVLGVGHRPFGVVGMDVLHPFGRQVGHLEVPVTQHTLQIGRQIHLAGLQVPVPDADLARLRRDLITPLALPQGLLRPLSLGNFGRQLLVSFR